MVSIDLNCDMGESYGHWTMGQDEAVMPYITSANIAAGYHAGDPHVMRETVALADQHDVSVGVHPGFGDKVGFGRRMLDATPEEVRNDVIYQLGALRAIAAERGVPFQHVKPHGAMYQLMSESREHARAVMEAILSVDDDLVFLAAGPRIYETAQEFDELRAVLEGYVDIDYRADRSLIVEKEKEPKDPDMVADRFERLALDGEIDARSGETIEVPARSVCIHGDGPNAVELLEAIHQRVADSAIELAPLRTFA